MQHPPRSLACTPEDEQLITASAGQRIQRTMRHGQTVWIKRMDCDSPSFGRKLHASLVSRLSKPYLKGSPLRSAAEQTTQEIRKITAFKNAGIPVPDIICAQTAALMLSDVGPTIKTRLEGLRADDPASHDNLLIRCTEALGLVHAAGLCHGRPHPRDMFLAQDGAIGFFDFEEEPEAVMSLSQAQARDLWLLFLHISPLSQDKENTPSAAFAAWRQHVSTQTVEDLSKLVRFFRIFLPALQFLQPIWLGNDGKRMLSAMTFFVSHLKI